VFNFRGFSTVKIEQNNFINNGNIEDIEKDCGLFVENLCYVNAKNNWWNSENGPVVNTDDPVVGDKIMVYKSIVLYKPFLTSPVVDAGIQE
jgi:hypothetical protein